MAERADAAIAVLGAITIRQGMVTTPVSNHGQRSILLLLASQVGRTVMKDVLIDHLWGENAPATARNMLHRNIGELRKLLEPGLPGYAEGRRILRVDGGYRLMATPDTLDLLRFREGVERARIFEAGRSYRLALDTFIRVLAMRIGPMRFGPARGALRAVAVPAVRQEYTAAFRDAIDLALRIDRGHDIVHLVRRNAEDLFSDDALRVRIEQLRTVCSDGRSLRPVG